jgi:hypothetical protein
MSMAFQAAMAGIIAFWTRNLILNKGSIHLYIITNNNSDGGSWVEPPSMYIIIITTNNN